MSAAASTTGREAVISRVFDAPRELVWAGQLPAEDYAKIETGVHGFHDRLDQHLQRIR